MEVSASDAPVDARRLNLPLWMWTSALILTVSPLAWGAYEIRSTRSEIVSLRAAIEKRPTGDAVKLATIDAVRPLERSIATLQAQVEQLVDRVNRIENKSR